MQFPKSISLYLPFGFILFSVIILQYVSYRNILHLKENNQASATYLKQNNILGKIKTDMIDADNIKTRIVYQDEKNIHKQFHFLLQSVTKNISLLQKNNSDTSFSKQIDTLSNLTVHYTLNENNVIRLYLSGQTEKAALLDSLSENDSYFDKIEDESDVLIDKYSRKAISLNETGYSKIQRLTFFSWLLTASLFLLIIYRTYHIIQEHEKDKLLHNHLKIAEADARKSSIVKDQFLANISHEIRTPMNAIIGFTKRLQKTKLTKEQAQYVHSVNVSGENLLTIINDILDFSKIEAGMYHIHEVVFNLPALLHDLQDLYALKVHEKNIAFTLTMDENIPKELLGDDVRLMQTFSNIVSNAIKFTVKGSIEIHAHIKEETEQILTIDIKIKDTGIGIPAEKINVIFERFQQASFDTNRQYGGTGLGLSIVKQIVELMHGQISVSSTEHVGSEFLVSIPFKKVNPKSKPQKHQMMQDNVDIQFAANILIVEDNPINMQLIELLLHDWKMNVEGANNGQEALEKLANKSYDIILMDIQMPMMNGYETTKIIRQDLHLQTPIIALTAHALAGEKEKCIEAGMNEYATKPINEDVLFSLIQKHLPKQVNNTEAVNNKAAATLINLHYTETLLKQNKQKIHAILENYRSDTPLLMKALQEAIQQNHFQQIAQHSHRLQSSISFVGLDEQVGIPLYTIEQMALQNRDIEQIKQSFIIIEKLVAQSLVEVNQIIERN